MTDEQTNTAPADRNVMLAAGETIDPEHIKTRNKLRKAGIICLIAALPLMCIPFVGIPLLFAGLVMMMYGYAGKLARYQAAEVTPVQKDTFNYLAEGTQERVKTAAEAAGQGLAAGFAAGGMKTGQTDTETGVRCHKCSFVETADAKFCSACGTALLKSKACPVCNELNDPDAKFCDNCGKSLSQQ